MTVLESVLNVLIVGLILGAGLPILYTVGIRLVAAGTADIPEDENGTGFTGNATLRIIGYAIYALTAIIILIAILWITRQTLDYYLHWRLFPDNFYKS